MPPTHRPQRAPAVALAAALALACTGASADGGWAFGIHFENDLFADTDQQYTNGIKLTAVSPDLSSRFETRDDLPAWLRDLLPLDVVPFSRGDGVVRTFAFSLGQNMYTPEDTASRDLVRDDRPYAGWLYGAATFQTRTVDRQDTFDLQLGVIGPPSFAEQTQELVHRARSLAVPQGWDHQLRTEPGIVLAYERAWRTRITARAPGFGADAVHRVGGALGNIATYVSAGTQLRVGWNLPPDFGYAVIRPGGVTEIGTLPNAAGGAHEDAARALRRRGFTAYGFAGVRGRAVAHDVFLDGNTFRDSHSVESQPFVADLMGGVTVGYGAFKLSLARVLRTREFRGQPKDHRFGSITLSYAF